MGAACPWRCFCSMAHVEETVHTTSTPSTRNLVLREHCKSLIVLPPSAAPPPTPPRRAAAASRRPPRRRRRRLGHGYDGRRQFILDPPEAHEIDGDVPRVVRVERVGLREVEAELRYNIGNSAPLVGPFQEELARRCLVQGINNVAGSQSCPHEGRVDALFARAERRVHHTSIKSVAQGELRVIVDATPHKIDDVVDVALCDISSR